MTSYRSAVACVVIAGLLSLLFHPRVVFGNGSGSSFVSFDDLFHAAQWGALLFAVLGFVFFVVAWKSGQLPSHGWVVLAFNIAVLTLLMFKGVPHKANRGEWRRGALGIREFIRGEAKRRAENRPPTQLRADTFAGTWRATDGATYTFSQGHVTRGGASPLVYSRENCGSSFVLEYIERNREALQDLGLTWSVHALAVYDSTTADARIPTANLTCGQEMVVFIRASPSEVWRVTSTLELDAIKSASFVLRRDSDATKP